MSDQYNSLINTFKNLYPEQKKLTLRNSANFPKTDLNPKMKPVLQTFYECESNKCDFQNVMKEIIENVDLKSFNQTDFIKEVFEVINEDQDYYIVHKLDNIHVYRNGFELIRTRRKDYEKDSQERSVYFDASDIRKYTNNYQDINERNKYFLIYYVALPIFSSVLTGYITSKLSS